MPYKRKHLFGYLKGVLFLSLYGVSLKAIMSPLFRISGGVGHRRVLLSVGKIVLLHC